MIYLIVYPRHIGDIEPGSVWECSPTITAEGTVHLRFVRPPRGQAVTAHGKQRKAVWECLEVVRHLSRANMTMGEFREKYGCPGSNHDQVGPTLAHNQGGAILHQLANEIDRAGSIERFLELEESGHA